MADRIEPRTDATVAIFRVVSDGAEDLLIISQVLNSGELILSGASPPRFIKRGFDAADLERFISESGLYTVLEVERYW